MSVVQVPDPNLVYDGDYYAYNDFAINEAPETTEQEAEIEDDAV